MMHQIDLYGVFLPSLAILALIALGVLNVLQRALSGVGAYRFVWHRPLFDLALYISVLGLLVMFSHWVLP